MMSRPVFLLCAGLLAGAALLGCPGQPPAPPVTTTTTLAPTPRPTPDLCPGNVAPLPGPAGDYVPAVWRPSEHLWTLIDLRDKVGGCDPANPYGKLENTALRLRRDYGLCAVWKEETVLVRASDNLFEEFYAVNLRTGCFATRDRMFRGPLAWIGAAK